MELPDLEDMVSDDDGDLDSDEDGEIGASQASDAKSVDTGSVQNLSAAHETGSYMDDEDYKDEDGTTMQDHEEFDIDKMIQDLDDDDLDFMWVTSHAK